MDTVYITTKLIVYCPRVPCLNEPIESSGTEYVTQQY